MALLALPRQGTIASTAASDQSPQHSRTPENYAASLRQASNASLQTELFSRVHFQVLSNYLTPRAHHDQPAVANDSGLSAPEAQQSGPFTHVVVHTVANGTVRRHDFDHEKGLEPFASFPDPGKNTDQIIFVRGSLSPAWIKLLGAKYKVEPDFFRRHMRYLPGRDHSDLPPLPSAAINTLTLSVTSLYTRSPALRHDHVKKRRAEDSIIVRKNQQMISARAACGETVLRRFSTINDRVFALEHDISIYLRERRNGSCLGTCSPLPVMACFHPLIPPQQSCSWTTG